jgi:uncharacterized protein YndB with AHSA1/START domain
MSHSVSTSRLIAAPAEKIFDLLADPTRHHEFDGSGSVQQARRGAPTRLALGTKFGMDMKIGLKYRITNEVVEFEDNRRIAWRHFGRHVWRYELEPTDAGTNVTETFDWTNARSRKLIEVMGYPKKNLAAMEATLERLASVTE